MNSKLRTDPMIELFNQFNRASAPDENQELDPRLLAGRSDGHAACRPCAGLWAFVARSRATARRHLLHPAEGPYKQVTHAPDLGLTMVDLYDGSFSKTKMFRVSGLPDEDRRHSDRDGDAKEPTGTFYVQFGGGFAACDLPGGAIVMVFTQNNLTAVPDGQGGTYFVGTLKLDITEATGIYQSFVAGHNTMVDILHQLGFRTSFRCSFRGAGRSPPKSSSQGGQLEMKHPYVS